METASKPTLLGLPREVRDTIINLAITTCLPPPKSPKYSMNRTRLDVIGSNETCDVCMADQPDHTFNVAGALVQVNGQLHDETKDMLGKCLHNCHVDIMFVKECGLWPTWLMVPPQGRKVDSFYVTVRIFDPPKGVDKEWINFAQFHRLQTPAEADFFVFPVPNFWNWYYVLTGFLQKGPGFKQIAFPAQSEHITVGRLAINVQQKNARSNHNVLARPADFQVNSYCGRRTKGFSGDGSFFWLATKDGQAQALVSQLSGWFTNFLLDHDWREDWGEPWIENIKMIKFYINREKDCGIFMNERIRNMDYHVTLVDPQDRLTREEQELQMAWQRRVILKRLAAGWWTDQHAKFLKKAWENHNKPFLSGDEGGPDMSGYLENWLALVEEHRV